MKTQKTTAYIVKIAMLSAVAFLLNLIDFPVPLMPSFVKLDISDLPALLGSFALGPVAGVIIEVLKNVLKLIVRGTSTQFVGELFSIVMGGVFVVVAGLIYKVKHTRAGAVSAAVAGAVAMALASLPMTYSVVYPRYATLFGGMERIIGAYQAIWGGAGDLFTCLAVFNIPFTFVKGMLDAVICFLIYKPLSPLLHRESFQKKKAE